MLAHVCFRHSELCAKAVIISGGLRSMSGCGVKFFVLMVVTLTILNRRERAAGSGESWAGQTFVACRLVVKK